MVVGAWAGHLRTLLAGAAQQPPARHARPAPLSPAQITFFHEQGYLILPGLFSPAIIDRVCAHLDRLWETRAEQGDLPIDIYFDTPDEARIFFRKAPDAARQQPYKILDLHLQDALMGEMCTDPELMASLGQLLGARALVCNSLLFEWGSQQYPHFDTFFMPSKTRNMMAASWIALDPVTEANGPLYFYPRSHLIEPFVFSHGKTTAVFSELKTDARAHIEKIVAEHRLERRLFLAQPGDVLIWHAQLLHGGSPIADRERTRRSLVTHYWTTADFPQPDQYRDLGEGRLLLRRPHQFVVDDEIMAEVDDFLRTVSPPETLSERLPPSFDARRYLARNQDVLRARVDPWSHYLERGQEEGRIW